MKFGGFDQFMRRMRQGEVARSDYNAFGFGAAGENAGVRPSRKNRWLTGKPLLMQTTRGREHQWIIHIGAKGMMGKLILSRVVTFDLSFKPGIMLLQVQNYIP